MLGLDGSQKSGTLPSYAPRGSIPVSLKLIEKVFKLILPVAAVSVVGGLAVTMLLTQGNLEALR